MQHKDGIYKIRSISGGPEPLYVTYQGVDNGIIAALPTPGPHDTQRWFVKILTEAENGPYIIQPVPELESFLSPETKTAGAPVWPTVTTNPIQWFIQQVTPESESSIIAYSDGGKPDFDLVWTLHNIIPGTPGPIVVSANIAKVGQQFVLEPA